jgi:uncharacterized membrane protein
MRFSRRSLLHALPLVLPLTFALSAIGGGPGDKGYTFVPIDDPDGATSVFGINSPGVMVGNFGDLEEVVHGFVLSAGQFTTVTVAGSPWSELWGVNSKGTGVGDYYDDTFTSVHGFTYAADGTITYLPDPVPGESNSPGGINSKGAVTGFYAENVFAPPHGYVYERGSFTYFDVPGSTYTIPNRITDSGRVCGFFSDASGNDHGFLRDREGNFTQIDVPGATSTKVRGMNEHGDIVGTYYDATTKHGFLLRKGVFLTLDYPGAYNTDVFDINNAGDIVGTYNDFSRGFLATPSSK